MTFTKNFGSDPLGERIYVLVHGDPKVGKTHMVLDLVREHGDYVILFSLDKGTMAVRQDARRAKAEGRKSVFQGKLMIAYPDRLREVRKDMQEAERSISKLARAGVDRSKIWVVLDTVTHLQSKLLAEARRINVQNPSAKDNRPKYVRDAVVETDWGINLTHMAEVADFLVNVKANVVVLALSKKEKIEREETGRDIPALSGQSLSRFMGDADTVAQLRIDKKRNRFLALQSSESLGGDRSGMLSDREPADLKHIQRKSIGIEVNALPADTETPKENGADAVTPAPQN